MRLLGHDGVLDDLRKSDDLAGEGRFGSDQPTLDIVRGGEVCLRSLAQDRCDPGMGILDVVDRVLGGLLLCELDVEVDLGGRGAGGEEPTRRVNSNFLEQLVQRDKLAGPLRHRDLDTVPDKPDPRVKQHLDGLDVVAHRLGGVPDSSDGPVMVRAPDVDQMVEAAAELLGNVADVGGEVGRLPIRSVDDAILVVTKVRRSEPDRAVLFVDVATLPQTIDGSLDPALLVQGGLCCPDVEMDAKSFEAGLDAVADDAGSPMTHND